MLIKKWKLLGTYKLDPCSKGEVRVEFVTNTGQEQSIANLRDGIVARMDGSYRQLVLAMAEYQALLDGYGWADTSFEKLDAIAMTISR